MTAPLCHLKGYHLDASFGEVFLDCFLSLLHVSFFIRLIDLPFVFKVGGEFTV